MITPRTLHYPTSTGQVPIAFFNPKISFSSMITLTRTDLGKVFALKGNPNTTAPLLISLAVRFQKYGKVLFIDANDRFNTAFVQKKYHKKTKLDLKKIKVARPFTAEQLLKLINNLHKQVPQTHAKAIIVSGLDKLLYDTEIHKDELPFLAEQIIEELRYVTQKFSLFTIFSFESKVTTKADLIQEVFLPHINFCCKV